MRIDFNTPESEIPPTTLDQNTLLGAEANGLSAVALRYHAAGRSVVPIAPGSKIPSFFNETTGEFQELAWKRFQKRPAAPGMLSNFFAHSPMGIGIICGPVSGTQTDGVPYALEVIDVDDLDILKQFVETAAWQGLDDLLIKLLHQRTPGGAGHFAYLCRECAGNTKLAQRQEGIDAHGNPIVLTLIETRGKGGQVVVAPTPPGIHPTHPERGYVLVRGSWEDVPTITPEERQALWALARSFNSYVAANQVHVPAGAGRPKANGERPGDALNARADLAWWRTLLEKHGWTLVHHSGDIEYWRRPGKEGKSWSATLGACGPYFYVFSSNAAPFEPERAYQPFSAFALLEYNGDFSAAAKALALAQDSDPPLYSDLYNACALVGEHGENILYCHPWKKWLMWTGISWQEDHTGAVMRLAKAVIRGLARQVETLDGSEARALLTHVKTSLATTKLKAMVESAQSELGIPVLPEALDQDPWLLNCHNGTLDLKTGTLRPHDRADLLTRRLSVPYDPAATCSTWHAFLDRIMAGNQNLIRFLQRAVGYALTGVIREHVLLILWGTGRNGKSTFLNTLRALLGLYAMKAPSELLMVSNLDRHPTERTDLFGKRFVAAIETEQGRRLAEVFVKEVTGGDPIRARRMREDFWEFEPTHKVFLATNHKPVITGTDTAIWERIWLVPFTVTIPEDERDTTLPDRLQTELPGILAWAVRGCLTWQQEGLGIPDEVRQATAGYCADMDVLGQFLADCCLVDSRCQAKAADLYDAYKRWCDQQGEQIIVQRVWGAALTERGFERYTNNGTWYRGVGVHPPTEGTEPYGTNFRH